MAAAGLPREATGAGTKETIVRMAADGSERTAVTELPVEPLSLSPDGREILARSHDSSLGASHVIVDTATGAIRARVDLPAGAAASWGPRHDVLVYRLNRDGASNLWEQPVAGGAPRQLTTFTSDTIFGFAYSPDRKRLYLSRGQRTGDVVVLRDFR
jgi:TolB protein